MPNRRAATVIVSLLAVGVGTGLTWPGPSAAAPAPGLETAMRERAAFGLEAGTGAVSRLIHSPLDVGSVRWGVPLTGEEEARLDLHGRMAFAHDVGVELLPFARELPSFAGAYLDQRAGGGLVVLLAHPDPEAERELLARRPVHDRGVTVRYVAHTLAALRAAARRAWTSWPAVYPEVHLRSVGVDTRNNRLRIRVSGAAGLLDPYRIRTIRSELRVAFTIDVGDAEWSAGCHKHDECDDPGLEAGSTIERGAPGGPRCTVGFHVVAQRRHEVLTAGHCGHGGPPDWYANEALVGRQTASLYGDDGSDVMRIRLSGHDTSTVLRGQSMPVLEAAPPIQGQVVCASLGRSRRVDCGTVSSEWVSWIDSICGCRSWGGDVDGIAIRQGDSGSPIYQLNRAGGIATAIGIVSTTSGKFAPVVHALEHWGATIAN